MTDAYQPKKYPTTAVWEPIEKEPTLRDQFAMASLQGMLAQGDYGGTDDLPEIAYRVADAMLKARAGEQE